VTKAEVARKFHQPSHFVAYVCSTKSFCSLCMRHQVIPAVPLNQDVNKVTKAEVARKYGIPLATFSKTTNQVR
jgi:hypothetical protein